MRLPDFLVIGAMKAGTTTLYRDLDANPNIFMPDDKEPGNLLTDDVRSRRGRRAYARHFKRARGDQVCGEATTSYTKLPDHPGIAARARQVLGPDLKVVYVVREPVSRIISHHFLWRFEPVNRDIDEAVRRDPRFINYTRYAMQITPWLETFGPRQVLIFRFEDYVSDRGATIDAISAFLGVEPASAARPTGEVHNRSAGHPLTRGPLAPVIRSHLYRRLVRPILGAGVRTRLRSALLPKADGAHDNPSLETVDFILAELRDDLEKLRIVMARNDDVWDLAAVRARYAGPIVGP